MGVMKNPPVIHGGVQCNRGYFLTIAPAALIWEWRGRKIKE